MFLGTYYHKLETNGRFSLPKAFRLKKASWIVTTGIDGGLVLLEEEQFTRELRQVSQRTFTPKKQRDFLRFVAGSARQVNVDKVGRVQLPEHLIKQAQLSKQLAVVGAGHHIEIWDHAQYHKYLEKIEPPTDEILEIKND